MIAAIERREAAIIRNILSCAATAVALVLVIYFGWSAGGSSDARVDLASAAATAPASDGPKTLVINTDRRGPHHVMRAIVTGPNGQPQGVSFIVDTGASDVVLPSSLMKRLGFEAADLPDLAMQTANGRVGAKQGVLKSLELGGPDGREVISRVTVLFISDASIGGVALLGMNVLGRYSMTIEDDQDRIVLVRRH